MIVKIDDGQIEAVPDLINGTLTDVRSQGKNLFDEDAPRERLRRERQFVGVYPSDHLRCAPGNPCGCVCYRQNLQ
jgi:hypothetical protein